MDKSLTPPLRLLFWESTSNCNLSCVHCRRQDTAPAQAAGDLNGRQARQMLDSAAKLGRPVIVFSGGEPLMRGDWEELAGYARSLGLPCALATNGTMIDKALAGRIASAAFHRVSVSLDGADATTHDALRGTGAFDRAAAGVAMLRQAGAAVQINATIAAHNVHQLDAIYALSRRLGAVALHLFLLVPVGCGAQIQQTHQLQAKRYEDVLNWICDRQDELRGPDHSAVSDFELKATCAPHYYRIAAQRGLPMDRRSRGCLAGIGVAFVSHTGEVYPCGYLPLSCGSVLTQDLGDIWRASPVFAGLRDYGRLTGKCGQCEFRAICGGCRARAYAARGDWLADEPCCTHVPVKATKTP